MLEEVVLKNCDNPNYSLVVPISRRWALPIVYKNLLSLVVPSNCELILFIDDKLLNADILGHMEKIQGAMIFNRFSGARLIFSNRLPFGDNAQVAKRRERIAQVWSEISEAVRGEVVLGFEDDTEVLNDGTFVALRLALTNGVCFASAVECGRWGIPYVGAWTITENRIASLPFEEGKVREVQGAGLYCFATYAEMMKRHDWLKPTDPLGCDVGFVQGIVHSGGKAQVDFFYKCAHHQRDGKPILVNAEAKELAFDLVGEEWIVRA